MGTLFEKKPKQINKQSIESFWGLSDKVSYKSGVFDMISVFPDPHLNH